MLYLLCTTFDGNVEITDYDSCVERGRASDRMDRAKYRYIVEINGSYCFYLAHEGCDDCDNCDSAGNCDS